ncbi:MAG: ATP-binding cassette domain-containing protein [Mucispirillum sp.]|nr:ATP-binding cassette domain-containing protein [Mucispirillum sp.]
MVRFVNVGVSFIGGYQALNNVNIEINRGEFVYIIGKSGAGKSTFLRLIYADILPSRGVVYVEGRDINMMGRVEVPFLRRQIGVVFQDYKLLENATVFDNVKLALDIFYMKRSAARERIWPLLKRVGIFEKRDEAVKNLSGGEKQRVAIARAIINDPKIILADEPTGNLDPENADNVMSVLRECIDTGTAVIMATHDANIREKYPAREIELEKGKVIRDGVRGEG